MKRNRVVTGTTMLFTAAIAVGLSGCSTLSPAVITTPYAAADGVGTALPGTRVVLRNFLVVGTAKNAPASVVGTIANDGPDIVQVSLQSDLGGNAQPKQTVISVGPNSSVQVGPDQTNSMVIADLAVAPGDFTELSAATQVGGRADLSVPVMLAQDEYASLTPSPEPTPTDTPAADATPTPSDTTSATKTSTKSGKKKAKGADTSTPSPTAT